MRVQCCLFVAGIYVHELSNRPQTQDTGGMSDHFCQVKLRDIVVWEREGAHEKELGNQHHDGKRQTEVEVTTYDGGGGEEIRLCSFKEGILCLDSRTGVSVLGANCIEDRRPSFEALGMPAPAKANLGLDTLSVTSSSSGTVCDDIDGAFKSGAEDLGEGPEVGEGD